MSRRGSSAFSMRQITCAFAPSARNGGLALDARAASSNISAPCANIRRQRAHQGSLSTGIAAWGKLCWPRNSGATIHQPSIQLGKIDKKNLREQYASKVA